MADRAAAMAAVDPEVGGAELVAGYPAIFRLLAAGGRMSLDAGRDLGPKVGKLVQDASLIDHRGQSYALLEMRGVIGVLRGYGFTDSEVTAFLSNVVWDLVRACYSGVDAETARTFTKGARAWFDHCLSQQVRQRGRSEDLALLANLYRGTIAPGSEAGTLADNGEGGASSWVDKAASAAGKVTRAVGGFSVNPLTGEITIGKSQTTTEGLLAPQSSVPNPRPTSDLGDGASFGGGSTVDV